MASPFPRQHSLSHYCLLITEFGAPNGLCSSITESKHIKAVKEPWRRSHHHEALSQMLLTNQHLDKLAAIFKPVACLMDLYLITLIHPQNMFHHLLMMMVGKLMGIMSWLM
jgi:hypothetical protein